MIRPTTETTAAERGPTPPNRHVRPLFSSESAATPQAPLAKTARTRAHDEHGESREPGTTSARHSLAADAAIPFHETLKAAQERHRSTAAKVVPAFSPAVDPHSADHGPVFAPAHASRPEATAAPKGGPTAEAPATQPVTLSPKARHLGAERAYSAKGTQTQTAGEAPGELLDTRI